MNRGLYYLGYAFGFLGIGIFGVSYYLESISLFMIGIFVLIFAIFYTIVVQTIQLFSKDKTLDLIELTKMGLTITKCRSCGKDNVLEDQYCIYCNEKLESVQDDIQEEH